MKVKPKLKCWLEKNSFELKQAHQNYKYYILLRSHKRGQTYLMTGNCTARDVPVYNYLGYGDRLL